MFVLTFGETCTESGSFQLTRWHLLYATLLLVNIIDGQKSCKEAVYVWTGVDAGNLSVLTIAFGDPLKSLRRFEDGAKTNHTGRTGRYERRADVHYEAVAYDTVVNNLALFDSLNRRIHIENPCAGKAARARRALDVNYVPLSSNVPGMAFLANSDLLYWIDAGHKHIGVVNFSKLRWKVIVDELVNPSAVAIDDAHKILFWSDTEPNRIVRSNLLGTARKSIRTNLELTPLCLVVHGSRLFWFDGRLKSSDFDGRNEMAMSGAQERASLVRSFVIHENYVMFGLTVPTIKVYRMSKENQLDLDVSFELKKLKSMYSQLVVSNGEKTNGTDRCAILCDHFCIPYDNELWSCECQLGYTLHMSMECRESEAQEGSLLFGDPKQGILYQTDLEFGEPQVVLMVSPREVEHALYVAHGMETFLYYSISGDLYRYNISSESMDICYRTPASDITDLVSDSTDLYVSSGEDIHALGLSTESTELVYNARFELITSMSLHPRDRILFFSECVNRTIVQFNLLTLEELGRTPLGLCVHAIAYDWRRDSVFFASGKSNIGNYMMAEKRLIFYPVKDNVIDLTFTGGNVYVATTSTIFKINIKTMSLTESKLLLRNISFVSYMPPNVHKVKDTQDLWQLALPSVLIPSIVVLLACTVSVTQIVLAHVKMKKLKRNKFRPAANTEQTKRKPSNSRDRVEDNTEQSKQEQRNSKDRVEDNGPWRNTGLGWEDSM